MKIFPLSVLLGLLMNNVHCKSPISKIIVLMMENRSFDHLLGWLKSLNPKIEGNLKYLVFCIIILILIKSKVLLKI